MKILSKFILIVFFSANLLSVPVNDIASLSDAEQLAKNYFVPDLDDFIIKIGNDYDPRATPSKHFGLPTAFGQVIETKVNDVVTRTDFENSTHDIFETATVTYIHNKETGKQSNEFRMAKTYNPITQKWVNDIIETTSEHIKIKKGTISALLETNTCTLTTYRGDDFSTWIDKTNIHTFESVDNKKTYTNITDTTKCIVTDVVQLGNNHYIYTEQVTPNNSFNHTFKLTMSTIESFGGIKSTEKKQKDVIFRAVKTFNEEINEVKHGGNDFDKTKTNDFKLEKKNADVDDGIFELKTSSNEKIKIDIRKDKDKWLGIEKKGNQIITEWECDKKLKENEYCEFDPTTTYSTINYVKSIRDADGDNDCTSSGSAEHYEADSVLVNLFDLDHGTYSCQFGMVEFSLSGGTIVPTDEISDMEIRNVDIDTDAGGSHGCRIVSTANKYTEANSTKEQMYDDFASLTEIDDGLTEWCSSTGEDKTIQMGSAGFTDLESYIDAGKAYYVIGWAYDSNTLESGHSHSWEFTDNPSVDPTLYIEFAEGVTKHETTITVKDSQNSTSLGNAIATLSNSTTVETNQADGQGVTPVFSGLEEADQGIFNGTILWNGIVVKSIVLQTPNRTDINLAADVFYTDLTIDGTGADDAIIMVNASSDETSKEMGHYIKQFTTPSCSGSDCTFTVFFVGNGTEQHPSNPTFKSLVKIIFPDKNFHVEHLQVDNITIPTTNTNNNETSDLFDIGTSMQNKSISVFVRFSNVIYIRGLENDGVTASTGKILIQNATGTFEFSLNSTGYTDPLSGMGGNNQNVTLFGIINNERWVLNELQNTQFTGNTDIKSKFKQGIDFTSDGSGADDIEVYYNTTYSSEVGNSCHLTTMGNWSATASDEITNTVTHTANGKIGGTNPTCKAELHIKVLDTDNFGTLPEKVTVDLVAQTTSYSAPNVTETPHDVGTGMTTVVQKVSARLGGLFDKLIAVYENDASTIVPSGTIEVTNRTNSSPGIITVATDGTVTITGLSDLQNLTSKDAANMILNYTKNLNVTATTLYDIIGDIYDVTCDSIVTVQLNGTDLHFISDFGGPTCASDILTWNATLSTHGNGDSGANVTTIVKVTVASTTDYGNSASLFTVNGTTVSTSYSSSVITSSAIQVGNGDSDIFLEFSMTLQAPAAEEEEEDGGGGAGTSSGEGPTTAKGLTLSLLGNSHKFPLGGGLENQFLTLEWNSDKEIKIIGIKVLEYPEWFAFQKVPFFLIGTSNTASDGKITYNVLPNKGATEEQFEIPVEVTAFIGGKKIKKTAIVKLDMRSTEDESLVVVSLIAAGGLTAIFAKVFHNRKNESSGRHEKAKSGKTGRKENGHREKSLKSQSGGEKSHHKNGSREKFLKSTK